MKGHVGNKLERTCNKLQHLKSKMDNLCGKLERLSNELECWLHKWLISYSFLKVRRIS
jgi:hypothetical protein